MKHFINKYVIFNKYNDTVVGTNLLNNVIFAIDNEKYKLLNDNKNNLHIIKDSNPNFFSVMLKLGVINIKKNDIYNELLLQNRSIVYNNNSYRLTINPTLNCNCNCWYCYETHIKKIMPINVVKRVDNFIENIVKNKGRKKRYIQRCRI